MNRNGYFSPFYYFFYLFLTTVFCIQAQVPSFRQYSLKQGLPQSEISTLFQDSRGIVWVGTRGGGLVEMLGNGNNRILNSKLGLSGDFIADVQETQDHKLAVGGTYGGIQLYNNRRFTKCPTLLDGYHELKKIAVLGNEVYGIADKIVFQISREKVATKNVFSFSHAVPEFITHGTLNNRWILASEDSGLWVIDVKSRARSLLLRIHEHLTDHKVVGINSINNTSAALVSADGYTAVVDFRDGWPFVSGWDKIQHCTLRSNEEIRCVVFGLGQNVKWYATTKRRVVSSSGEVIDLSQSVSNLFHSINCLMQDRNGAIWIGTQGSGLVIKPAHTGYSFENFPPFMNTNLRAVHISMEGKLMAGGKESGLLIKEWNPVLGKESIRVLFPDVNIFSIGDSKDRYYIGTDKGLFLMRKSDYKVLSFFSEPGKTIMLKLLPSGELLIGTYGSGIWRLDQREKLIRVTAPDVDPRFIYGFQEDKPGQFLIPSNSGLWNLEVKTSRISRVQVPDTIGPLFFISTKDSHQNIWFATSDGLVAKTKQGWNKIRIDQGLSSNLLYTLNGDALGHLWIGTNQGLDRVTVGPAGELKEVRNFGPEEGYDGYEANMRASYLHEHTLYICTIQGLFAMPVKSKVLDPLPPKPQITHVRASFKNGNWVDSIPGLNNYWYMTDLKGVVLEDNPAGISLSFSSINPIYPNRLYYSYLMDDNQRGWSPLKPETEAFFINPESGRHTFKVRTSYDGLSFSQPTTFEFEIKAPWYLSTGALLSGVVLVMLFVLVAARLLLRSFSEQRYLRQDLPEKTSQIILLIFTVFYPVTLIVSSRFEPSIYFNAFNLALVTGLVGGFFVISFLVPTAKRHIRMALILSFLIFIADTSWGIIQSNMAPFHIVALLYISTLAFLVFNKYWQIIAYGVFLNSFALFCNFYFDQPLYSPVPFQMGATGLSIILVIIHLAKQSGEEKLVFANKVVNSGPVLVLGFKFDGTLVFSSENMYEILGFSNWEVAGRIWWSEVVGRNEDVLTMLRSIQEKKETELKVHLKSKKGDLRMFKFAGRAINEEMMVLMGQDITESEALEARFENLVENAPDAIYQTDFYGRIVYANPQTSFILGISNKDLIGRSYTEFLREDMRDTVIEYYSLQTKSRVTSTYHEFPVVTRTGQVRWLGFQVSLLTSDGGKKIEGYLSIGRDITERLEAEQLIQYQHKNITDSLTYANRIKSAILPGESALKTLFTHVAVYNKPKDIIGGDFFWLTHFGKKHVFVLGDCTGHGVPGAFMTTIAVGLLRETVKEDSNWNVEEILGLFNRSLVRLLGSNSEIDSPDFVELALLAVDFEQNKIQFISSGISLNLLRKGEIETFQEGSRGQNYRYDYRGMSQEIFIQPGDVFYLFTDGMFDQLGGPSNKRLTKKGLKEIIRKSNHQSLQTGMEEIRSGLEAWQGSFPQIDDRLMISFRF